RRNACRPRLPAALANPRRPMVPADQTDRLPWAGGAAREGERDHAGYSGRGWKVGTAPSVGRRTPLRWPLDVGQVVHALIAIDPLRGGRHQAVLFEGHDAWRAADGPVLVPACCWTRQSRPSW